jgi:hypothetical protein
VNIIVPDINGLVLKKGLNPTSGKTEVRPLVGREKSKYLTDQRLRHGR